MTLTKTITLEKTWAFDFNRAYTPSTALDLTRYTMWLLASQLTGNTGGLVSGLWTLYASSNSITAGTDSTDRWSLTSYDGTKIVRGASSAVHSWIVLQSPVMNGSNWYMILSFNSASDDAMRLSFCKAAPTGGSTTVTPTSTNQWWPANTSLAAVDSSINNATAALSRFNIGLSSGGDFYFIGCRQYTNFANLIIQFHALSNYSSNDLAPVWNQITYNTAGKINFTDQNRSSGAFSYNPSSTTTRKYDLTGTAYANTILAPTITSGTSTILPFPPGTFTATQEASDIFSGRPFIYQTLILHMTFSVTLPQIRGRIADIFVSTDYPTILGDGISVAPINGNIQLVKVAGLLFPANTTLNFG